MKQRLFVTSIYWLAIILAVSFPSVAFAQDEFIKLNQGTKYKIGDEFEFIYSFNKTPSLGIVVVKIQVFNKNGEKDYSLKIFGESGMPEMKGHHDSGVVEFKQNKSGDYLLPVDAVMPGAWEVRVVFKNALVPIFKGRIDFDI